MNRPVWGGIAWLKSRLSSWGWREFPDSTPESHYFEPHPQKHWVLGETENIVTIVQVAGGTGGMPAAHNDGPNHPEQRCHEIPSLAKTKTYIGFIGVSRNKTYESRKPGTYYRCLMVLWTCQIWHCASKEVEDLDIIVQIHESLKTVQGVQIRHIRHLLIWKESRCLHR